MVRRTMAASWDKFCTSILFLCVYQSLNIVYISNDDSYSETWNWEFCRENAFFHEDNADIFYCIHCSNNMQSYLGFLLCSSLLQHDLYRFFGFRIKFYLLEVELIQGGLKLSRQLRTSLLVTHTLLGYIS